MDIEKARKKYIPMSETMMYILLSLQREMHGYGVMQYVKGLTNGRITLGAGTVYQSIGKLERDGLIRHVMEIDRKKTYIITDTGKVILKEEKTRIIEIYHNLEGVL